MGAFLRCKGLALANLQKDRADGLEAKLTALQTPAQADAMPKLADFETPEQWATAATAYANVQTGKQVKEQVAEALQKFGIDKSAAEREQGFQDDLVKEAEPLGRLDLNLPLGIVVGHEGSGLRRLVRERCDFLLALPMRGQVNSLNAATAGAVILYSAWQARGFEGAS